MISDIDQRKRMEETLRDSEAHLRRENLRLRTTIQQRNKFGDIVGASPAMQEIYELMLMAAASDANIILYGESGTGKELAASAIHNMSDRRKRPFRAGQLRGHSRNPPGKGILRPSQGGLHRSRCR